MAARKRQHSAPGPRGAAAAGTIAALARSPLDGYVRLAARYGDAVEVPIAPGRSFYVLSRPEHAEHVLAASQDNYVKAFTYRPLRALIGDGLLTSEGSQWRRHRRIIQPVFSRKHVAGLGPPMTAAAQRMISGWDALPDGSEVNVAAQMGALALDIVGRALFGADLTGDSDQMSRAMNAGQKVAVLATFLPLPWGPRSTRLVRAAARRLGRVPEGIEGPVERLIRSRREQLALGRSPAGQAGKPAAAAARQTGPRQPAQPEPADLLGVLLAATAADGGCSPLPHQAGAPVARFFT